MILALTGAPLIILSIIAFILIIGIIIIIHEAGHLILAKRAGILCHEFSIGMGPVIYKKKKGETVYCVRAIPIGGYVSMAGEEVTANLVKKEMEIGINLENDKIVEIILDDKRDCQIRGRVVDCDLYAIDNTPLFITLNHDNQDYYYEVVDNCEYVFEHDKRMQITPYERSFDSKPMLDRILTIAAGPIMNLILAIIIYIIVSFSVGVPNYNSNVIGEISQNFPADKVLAVGDKITKINGVETNTWDEFQKAMDTIYENDEVSINLEYIPKDEAISKVVSLEALTIINSIGLSNVDASNNPKDNGVVLGTTALRAKGEGKTPQKGDILTGIKIGDEEITINSWTDLIRALKPVSAVDVRFEFYPYDEETNTYKEIVGYKDSIVATTYTNEVLNNQRIEKIVHYIGVSPEMHFSFGKCLGNAFVNFWNDFTLIFRTLKLLIAPSEVRQIGVGDLSSFVGIYSVVQKYVGAGFLPLLSFMALLSVNIGVMNLLPIPALDGGRLVFLLYELITRRKPSKKVEATINNVFFILLMILMVYITFNDILRLF